VKGEVRLAYRSLGTINITWGKSTKGGSPGSKGGEYRRRKKPWNVLKKKKKRVKTGQKGITPGAQEKGWATIRTAEFFGESPPNHRGNFRTTSLVARNA